jgi:hypothetical protein
MSSCLDWQKRAAKNLLEKTESVSFEYVKRGRGINDVTYLTSLPVLND